MTNSTMSVIRPGSLRMSLNEHHAQDFASMFKTNLAAFEPIEDRLNTYQTSTDHYARLFFQQENDTFVPLKQISRSFSLSNEGNNVSAAREIDACDDIVF